MSVRPNANNKKWIADTVIDGKRVQVQFNSRKKAEEFEGAARLKKFGLSGMSSNYPLSEAFAMYLQTESSQKSQRSASMDARFLGMALYFFTKERGHSFVEQVRVEDLQLFQLWVARPQKIGDVSKEAWTETSVARHCSTLKAVFKKLFKTKRVIDNPAAYWVIPKGESAQRRPMTIDEFKKLCGFVPSWFLPILRTLRLTGARGKSIGDLTWDKVDFSSGCLLLSSRKGGRGKLKMIPTPIGTELREILSHEWNRNPTPGPVFRDQYGNHVSGRMISAIGCKAIKDAGLQGVVLYGLRHAFATDLLAAGVSTDIARRLMGHSTEKQIQGYSHFMGIDPLLKAVEVTRPQESLQQSASVSENEKQKDK